MRRHGFVLGVVLSTTALTLWATAPEDLLGERTGGDTTVYATGKTSFSQPLATLLDAERTRFALGNSFFKRNWVEAPSSTAARDGLGPHFIARSCRGCHAEDGRGQPPNFRNSLVEQPVALLMRLSLPGKDAHGDALPEPTYGGQFNNAAVTGVKPEGEVVIRYSPLKGRFADGTPYTLQKPHYSFKSLGYGPMSPLTMTSPRIAPQIAGSGLLEAIADSDILQNAQHQANTTGPIKGQINRVWDAFAGEMRIGRFGWKANVASLAHQTAGAFLGDIGITSSKFPLESCTARQKDCLDAPSGGGNKQGPEIDDTTLGNVIFYQAALAPAARRNASDPQVLQGQRLFAQAQCAACHHPSYITGKAPFPALSSPAVEGQRIWPYTDLLLHDMGKDLADNRPDFLANGRQWKTPPLWGIGLIRTVNGHQKLLHDGRADGVLEAILWHGGEAEAAKKQVLRMSRAEREALVKFVESL